jgi:hypothetical protein
MLTPLALVRPEAEEETSFVTLESRFAAAVAPTVTAPLASISLSSA